MSLATGLTAVVALLGSALALGPMAASAQTSTITAFVVDSEVGDYVGQGQVLVITPANGMVTASGDQFTVAMRGEQGTHLFDARVRAPLGQPLLPGTYPIAEQPDATHAGLTVGGDGRGCASRTGTLEIHEVVVSLTVVQAFAASYEQHCEGTDAALFGELRYNSTVPYRAADAERELTFDVEYDPDDSPKGTGQLAHVTSLGSSSLEIGQTTIEGVDASRFSLAIDDCSERTITPGNSCTIDITFTAQDLAPRQALLRIPDGTYRGERVIVLRGVPRSEGSPPPPSTGEMPTDQRLRSTATKTKLFGEYGRRGHYELFHIREPVVQAGFLTPRGAGRQLNFEIQIKHRGNWRTLATEDFRIRRGVAAAVFGARRGTYRANNSFDGNATFAASTSKWQYFKVTA